MIPQKGQLGDLMTLLSWSVKSLRSTVICVRDLYLLIDNVLLYCIVKFTGEQSQPGVLLRTGSHFFCFAANRQSLKLLPQVGDNQCHVETSSSGLIGHSAEYRAATMAWLQCRAVFSSLNFSSFFSSLENPSTLHIHSYDCDTWPRHPTSTHMGCTRQPLSIQSILS